MHFSAITFLPTVRGDFLFKLLVRFEEARGVERPPRSRRNLREHEIAFLRSAAKSLQL